MKASKGLSELDLVYRDNNVQYHTIIFCTIQYCSALHEYLQQEATQSDLPIFLPFFPLGKRGASMFKKLW
jgi:hypothetical protein